MNKAKHNSLSQNEIEEKFSMSDIHDELNEFYQIKKTVTDLMEYRRSLIDIQNSDFEKINEIKGRAIDAINNLFNEAKLGKTA